MPHPVFDGPDWGVITHNMSNLVIDCSSVSCIDNRAYYNETDLKTVEFLRAPRNQKGNNEDGKIVSSQLISIGTEAFAYCKALQRLDSLPTSIRCIGKSAFVTCMSLQFVDLPDSLQTIGESAFLYCIALISIRIPSSVTRIDDKTFEGCIQLRSLELPTTLKSIGYGAFRDCSSLMNICLPSSVEELPRLAFGGCTLLLIKLQSFSNEGLLKSLQQRYQDLPLNNLCYYQSYSASKDGLLLDLQEILTKDDDSLLMKTDALGMNPLHVLALSVRPNCDLSCILMNHIRRKIGDTNHKQVAVEGIMSALDVMGNDTLTYAFYNRATGSGEFIAQLLKVIHTQAIAQLGCQQWRNKILCDIDRLFLGDELGSFSFESRRRKAKEVQSIIKGYLLKERFACLEIGIWKSRLANGGTLSNDPRHREDCRTTCGSNVILSNVVGFLSFARSDKT